MTNIRDSRGGVEAYEVAPTRKTRGIITIPMVLAAGVPQKVGIAGDYFHVFTAPVADLKARFDDSRQQSVFQGVGFRVYYDDVELESATGQTILVGVGFGSVADARAAANVNVTTNVAPGATVNNGGDVSCLAGAATQLLALDATRLVAYITNSSANSVTLRLGTAAVAAATGVPLEPGTTLPFPTTAAIWAWNPSGGVVTLSAASVRV